MHDKGCGKGYERVGMTTGQPGSTEKRLMEPQSRLEPRPASATPPATPSVRFWSVRLPGASDSLHGAPCTLLGPPLP